MDDRENNNTTTKSSKAYNENDSLNLQESTRSNNNRKWQEQ